MDKIIILKNLKELKRMLFSKTGTKTQKELAEHLEMSASTLSRILNGNIDAKAGPEIKNVEKIVKVLSKDFKESEQEIRESVYLIAYGPEVLQKKLEEYGSAVNINRNQKENELDGNKEKASGSKEETNVKEDTIEVIEQQEKNWEKLQDVVEEILKVIGYKIRTCEKNKKLSTASVYEVFDPKFEYAEEPFKPPYIDIVLGVWLSEENYLSDMNYIEGLAKDKKGVIIICSETIAVFERVRNDKERNLQNNILLYWDKNSRLFVKSIGKGQRSFLKEIFGKENLVFPKK